MATKVDSCHENAAEAAMPPREPNLHHQLVSLCGSEGKLRADRKLSPNKKAMQLNN